GRTDQAVLFPVPTAKNDRATWLPPALEQLSKGAANFQHRRRAAVWIHRAEYPGITMIAHNHPTILFRHAINPRDHVPKCARLVIHVGLQMDAHIIGAADVIRKRKTALETARTYWPFQWLDQFASFVVSERLHRDARNVCVSLFQS